MLLCLNAAKLVVALDWVKFLLVFFDKNNHRTISVYGIFIEPEYGRYEVQLGSAVSLKNRSLDRASIKRALYLYFLDIFGKFHHFGLKFKITALVNFILGFLQEDRFCHAGSPPSSTHTFSWPMI
jgi:hypothetical protein